MSLTDATRRADGLVGSFLDVFLPELQLVWPDIYRAAYREHHAETTAPPGQVPNRGYWSPVGSGIDYRIRMCVSADVSPWVLRGVAIVRSAGVDGPAVDGFELEANSMLRRITAADPARLVYSARDDNSLARLAYRFGQLDATYRAGPDRSGLAGIPNDELTSLDTFLASVPDQAVADIAALARVAAKAGWPAIAERGQQIAVGPRLSGAALVGGADADIVIDRTLFEIKATMYPLKDPKLLLRQLVGYVLLDFDNELELNTVAVYLARQGVFLEFKLREDIISVGAGASPQLTLAQLREAFVEYLNKRDTTAS